MCGRGAGRNRVDRARVGAEGWHCSAKERTARSDTARNADILGRAPIGLHGRRHILSAAWRPSGGATARKDTAVHVDTALRVTRLKYTLLHGTFGHMLQIIAAGAGLQSHRRAPAASPPRLLPLDARREHEPQPTQPVAASAPPPAFHSSASFNTATRFAQPKQNTPPPKTHTSRLITYFRGPRASSPPRSLVCQRACRNSVVFLQLLLRLLAQTRPVRLAQNNPQR